MSKEIFFVLVDDEKEILESFEDKLKDYPAKVMKFSNPLEAINFIEKNKKSIALIFSDLKMPEMTGMDIKVKLNEVDCNEIPFCIITAFWNKELSLNALEIGVKAFIEKPIDDQEFNDLVVKHGMTRYESIKEEFEMVQGFLDESRPMLDEIEGLILQLEENPEDHDVLAVYFRLLHTIKGTASCVGLTKLGNFTHYYEDFIGELRTGKLKPSTQTTNILLAGLDLLKNFFNVCEQDYSDHKVDNVNSIAIFDVSKMSVDHVEIAPNDSVDEYSAKEDHKDSSIKSEKKKESDKLSIEMSILDSFMEENGELTVVRNSIIKTVKRLESKVKGDKDIEVLNELLKGMYDITSNIQTKITEMRKVSLKNVFRPFKRLVRDISKALNKEVDLEIIGEELFVDNVIAKLYSNTLIHLIRNSLDHGIETKIERVNKGKSGAGKLTIKVEQKGELINLQIIDDGKGINPEIIKKKSLEKNLFTEAELQKMSKSEVLSIIFHSGFSTAAVVSDLSGRGVGMDMVRGSFEELGGAIKLESEVDKGTTFNLLVPIPKSVLIINALQIEAAGQLYLFSMDEVVEVLNLVQNTEKTQINHINNSYYLRHNGHFYEICFLDKLLKGTKRESIENLNIVILKFKKKTFAVAVDKIYEFEEVVMRKISNALRNSNLYQGAALLGNGEVSLILSSEGLLDKIGVKQVQTTKRNEFQEEQVIADDKSVEYIWFRNARKEILAIELNSVYRFENLKKSQLSQTGNNYIINYFGKALPVIDPFYTLKISENNDLNSDFVESRMIVIKHQGQSIGILVGQIGEVFKTDQMPDNSTLDLVGLLGSIFVNEQTICVVDSNYLIDKKNWNPAKNEKASLVEFEWPEAA